MRFIIINFLFMISLNSNAESILYFSRVFGHIHLKPYANSSSVTGVSCGEKLKIDSATKAMEQDWYPVLFGAKKGFVYKGHVSSSEPNCLQADYPVFFQALELDLTEIFLWGRLNDQFIEFETGR